MTLIKSISGIRGTIGGKPGEALTPLDAVKYAAAYGQWLSQNSTKKRVVVGRDARPSGAMISSLVIESLIGMGFDVVDLGLSTTPTVEMAVVAERAGGGIILTASHNPKNWNALKLLNENGEFISGKSGEEILKIAESNSLEFSGVDELGKLHIGDNYIEHHIAKILELDLVNIEDIKSKSFRVAIDAVNSTGGIAIPPLLNALGVHDIIELYCEPNGQFPHNPEPLPQNLGEISRLVKEQKADLGIVVDPDVDRLCFISEDGSFFGEEYTLVAIADYILSKEAGTTVSNLSSTRVLKEVAARHESTYHPSKVGEVNVVAKMKEVGAKIGGEGNGGIILADLHYGRDALVGIALFLSHLAAKGMSMTELRASYPNAFISKKKIDIPSSVTMPAIMNQMEENHMSASANREDGLRLDFSDCWVHMRKSNTEPIVRIYAEAATEEKANDLADQIIQEIHDFCGE